MLHRKKKSLKNPNEKNKNDDPQSSTASRATATGAPNGNMLKWSMSYSSTTTAKTTATIASSSTTTAPAPSTSSSTTRSSAVAAPSSSLSSMLSNDDSILVSSPASSASSTNNDKGNDVAVAAAPVVVPDAGETIETEHRKHTALVQAADTIVPVTEPGPSHALSTSSNNIILKTGRKKSHATFEKEERQQTEVGENDAHHPQQQGIKPQQQPQQPNHLVEYMLDLGINYLFPCSAIVGVGCDVPNKDDCSIRINDIMIGQPETRRRSRRRDITHEDKDPTKRSSSQSSSLASTSKSNQTIIDRPEGAVPVPRPLSTPSSSIATEVDATLSAPLVKAATPMTTVTLGMDDDEIGIEYNEEMTLRHDYKLERV